MPTLYLAIYEKKLFDDNFEAWVHGPVNPQLYTEYREYGWQEIPQEINYPNSIMKNERVREIIEEVYESYGHLDGSQLEYLTRQEDPWKMLGTGYSRMNLQEMLLMMKIFVVIMLDS
ncbi:DUF4065 domain-containing protein [Paenibacillus larvae]|nr:type II toxin-antitoxin system antitoxin SocA domain-containing protein [Paenibacillus larvae]MDT2265879.1 DUF4065 domain-containing protein [Paenibacillus larvae]